MKISQAMMREIHNRQCSGERILDICADLGLPSPSRVSHMLCDWRHTNGERGPGAGGSATADGIPWPVRNMTPDQFRDRGRAALGMDQWQRPGRAAR